MQLGTIIGVYHQLVMMELEYNKESMISSYLSPLATQDINRDLKRSHTQHIIT